MKPAKINSQGVFFGGGVKGVGGGPESSCQCTLDVSLGKYLDTLPLCISLSLYVSDFSRQAKVSGLEFQRLGEFLNIFSVKEEG